MTSGRMTFVLHSHLPYCRLAGRWPHGEEWFHEAMLECYLPLVRGFRELAQEIRGPLGVTINLTPILAEQMGDGLMLQHFREYLGDRIARAHEDVSRFADGDSLRGRTARFHAARYDAIQRLFEEELGGDILGAFRALEEQGRIEIATCAATHGYLPLLQDDAAVRLQVQTGVQSHRRNFGRQPRSFWLPECAYRPGLEQFLEEAGIRVFFVETHLVTGGLARGKTLGGVVGVYPETRRRVSDPARLPEGAGTTFRAYHAGHSDVSVLARNERVGLQVWSASHGYPGDPAYREFHRKDDESGLHYWRLTGADVDLGDKAEYDPAAAAAVVGAQAAHFHQLVRSELEAYRSGAGENGIVMASYDTELFGHWWLEGVEWLKQAIRSMAEDPAIELTSAEAEVRAHPPAHEIDLPEGSWGNGGDHRTWQNADTEWTWPEVRGRQARAHALLQSDTPQSRQLARELLLLQSSDWQFLMTTGQAHDYAVERFQSHCARFDELATAMEAGDSASLSIAETQQSYDNPFPDIDPLLYSAAPIGVRG